MLWLRLQQKMWALGMGRRVETSAVALAMLLGTAAAAAPAGKCAKPDEVSAIQTAAIQQELMVAALTCNEITRFNAFQTGFGPELRTSDALLAKMFKRLYGARQGEAEYHAFKTRLANDSSIRSIHDNLSYCHEAAGVFDAALAGAKPVLAAFVSTVPVSEQSPVDSCELRVAMTLKETVAGTSAADVIPKPKPQMTADIPATAAGAPAVR